MSDAGDVSDDQETITVDDLEAGPSPLGSPYLLLHLRGGVRLVRLPEEAGVVIGRAAPADVVVDDPSLSRTHARFERRGGEIWVADLDSKNGTRVNGEPSARHLLAPGDEIRLGSLAVTLHPAAGGGPAAEGLVGHEALMLALEREVVRARLRRRPLALLRIRATERAELQRRYPDVLRLAQPASAVAVYGPGELHVLLTDTTPEQALARAEELAERLRELGCAARIGVAGPAGSADELVEACRRAVERCSLERPVRRAPDRREPPDVDGQPLATSPAMEPVLRMVERLALSTIPVLIQGETGTGKEVVARAIHRAGPRRDGPLRCLNCGAIPEQLVESALFGHERGAFTGADRAHAGIFEQARGGTVLLDEIGELSPSSQVALLRVIETGKVTRVGAAEEIELDARILAATNRDLEAMCADGAFRQDLLFRLNAMTLEVPPLRDRVEEIPALAERFLARARQRQPTTAAGISPAALDLLRRYRWPGNVRELRNVIERAVIIAGGDQLVPEDLSERVRAVAAPDRGQGDEVLDFRTRIQRHEAELILEALRESGWNQSEAARRLNMPLRTMVRKVQAYGLRRAT